MTVRTRLLLTIGGIIALLIVPAAYGITQLQHLRDLAEELEQAHAADALAVGNLRAALAELDRMQRSYVITPEPSFLEGMHTQVRLARGNLDLLDQPRYREPVADARRMVAALDQASHRLEALGEAGRVEEATDYFERVKPVLDSARLALLPIRQALDEHGAGVRAEARQVSAAATRTTMLVILVSLIIALLLGLWTVDALSRPLRRLGAATAAVAEGRFEAPPGLPYDRDDEIGDLSRAFGSMTEQLAELDRLKAEFISLASHELKTPINVIVGYAELLEEGLYGELDHKQRNVLRLVQEQADALTRLVNQLLDLSRFEAGGLAIEPGPVEPRRLLAEVEGSFRALATQKQIDFTVDAEPSLPERVELDHDRVRHEVLSNVLSNAFKFTPPAGAVRVRAWGEDDRIRFEIEDTGVGIPAEDVPHIFDKYYQVGADAKSKGAGLGLAIAKHIVEAHGGSIAATSEVGAGTTFRITLPRDGPPA